MILVILVYVFIVAGIVVTVVIIFDSRACDKPFVQFAGILAGIDITVVGFAAINLIIASMDLYCWVK